MGTEDFFSKAPRGVSLLVWGEVSIYWTSFVADCKGNVDSEAYRQKLQQELQPFAAEKFGVNCLFQQDDAAAHRSNYTNSWLLAHKVDVLE